MKKTTCRIFCHKTKKNLNSERVSEISLKTKNPQKTNLKSVLAGIIFMLLCTIPSNGQLTLRTNGTIIENTSNEEVVLKGVNLGQWLMMEGFMSGSNGGMGQVDMKRKIKDDNHSSGYIEYLFDKFRANFITEDDIEQIAAEGFNCVRLPLHYELFLTDAQREERNEVIYLDGTAKEAAYYDYRTKLGTWVNNYQLAESSTVDGFTIIDNLITWCKAREIYIILDMHIVPGTAGTEKNITDELYISMDFFNNYNNRAALYRIWDRISERYKNENTICMYDLINEPHQKIDGSSVALSYDQMTQLKNSFNQLINLIRENGDDKMILLQGDSFGNDYNQSGVTLYPSNFTNSTNLVYNIHRYRSNNSLTAYANNGNIGLFGDAAAFQSTHNVPVFCGETGLDSDYNELQGNFEAMESLHIGWALWSWKTNKDNNSGDSNYRKNGYRFPYDVGGNDPWDDLDVWYNETLLDQIKFSNCTRNPEADFWTALTSTISNNNNLTLNFYQIINNNSSMAMREDSPYDGTGAYVKQDANGGTYNSTQWEFIETADAGYYNIKRKGYDKIIIAESGTDGASIALVDQSTNQDWQRAKWMLEDAKNGLYYIKNKWPGFYLRPLNGSTTDDINLVSQSFNAENSYKWSLEPISLKSSTLSEEYVEVSKTSHIKFYPNPVNDILTIEGTSNYSSVRIFNLYGQLTEQIPLKNKMSLSIDMTNYSTGTYYIQLIGNSGNTTEKIIKK